MWTYVTFCHNGEASTRPIKVFSLLQLNVSRIRLGIYFTSCFMGRTEPTVVLPPAAFRRDVRAKQAKATINRTIPALLASNTRARRGVDAAELIADPSLNSPAGSPKTKDKVAASAPQQPLRIRLQVTDSLSAAAELAKRNTNSNGKVAVLNMASPLVPGGGFVNGATSQEEFLCLRTTLYPSLKDSFYRLPEIGAVYTPDVLVFRDKDANDLNKKDRFFVDVVSAGMLRFPDVEEAPGDGNTDSGSVGQSLYVHSKDRELAIKKMRAVMRILQVKGARRVVMGAWGCGAYGNPVGEVAKAWKRVLFGEKRKKKAGKAQMPESWDGIEEVVFAVSQRRTAVEFARHFGGNLVVEDNGQEDIDDTDAGEDSSHAVQELRSKITELEGQITQVRSTHLRAGLESVLEGLRKQLEDKKGVTDVSDGGSRDDEIDEREAEEGGVRVSDGKRTDEETEDADSQSDNGPWTDDAGVTSDHDHDQGP